MQRKYLAVLLALCMLLGAVPFAVSAGAADATATECNHVYTGGTISEGSERACTVCGAKAITTAQELFNLMGTTLTANYVLVPADGATLDLSTVSGTQSPIKISGATFDGNGVTVKGVALETSTAQYLGFFGDVRNNAVIKDLTICGQITSTYYKDSTSKDARVGGIAAYVAQGATIENCKNYCNISGGQRAGGIVGCINTSSSTTTTISIIGCENHGTIEGNTTQSWVGGILGSATLGTVKRTLIISECKNTASITGTANVGGIVGWVSINADGSTSEITVDACTNTGNVTANNDNVGGIAGYIVNKANKVTVTFANCINGESTANTVKGNTNVGGIIGYLGDENTGTSTKTAEISACINYATVTATADDGVSSNIGAALMSGTTVSDSYYKDGDTYKLAGASDSSSDISTLKALLIALNGGEKNGVWVYNSEKNGVVLDSDHECGDWTKESSEHTCPKCEYAEEHDWEPTSDNSQHICSVCEKTAAHNFTDSECACGLVQLTITSLTVEDGSLKATFANNLGSDATLDTSEIEVSENAGTYTVSGLKVNGDYVLASDSHTIDAAYIGTVTATVDGEDAGVSIPYIKGMSVEVTLSSPADKEGYDFTGWKVGGTTYATSTFTIPASMTNTDSLVIEAVYTEQTVNDNENPNSNINYNNNVGLFIALAAKNSRQCVITYKSTGANTHVFETVKKGTVLQMPETPTKDGYTFVGWYKDINGTKPFNFNAKITGNVSIYAKWVKN